MHQLPGNVKNVLYSGEKKKKKKFCWGQTTDLRNLRKSHGS